MAGTTEKLFQQLRVNYGRLFFFLRHLARGHRADEGKDWKFTATQLSKIKDRKLLPYM